MKKKQKLTRLVMCALFSALIIVMTFVPYLGYISIGPVEITTLHIVAVFGAMVLGPSYGGVIGGVWGLTCIARAFQLGFIPFQNPMVSLVPRILVGVIAGLIFKGLSKTKLKKPLSLGISTLVGTLTNTVLVLTSLRVFGGFEILFGESAKTIDAIVATIIGTNGIIELVSAIIIVPSLYMATEKYFKSKI